MNCDNPDMLWEWAVSVTPQFEDRSLRKMHVLMYLDNKLSKNAASSSEAQCKTLSLIAALLKSKSALFAFDYFTQCPDNIQRLYDAGEEPPYDCCQHESVLAYDCLVMMSSKKL